MSKNLGQVNNSLLENRISSIGWYFIVSYYEFISFNVENIYKIYLHEGSVNHAVFPGQIKGESEESKVVYKAKGHEAIKEYFKGMIKEKNKIVVTGVTFDICLQNSILIVVFGEWSKENSQFNQFTQTFVLVPGKKEKTFDLCNDVLRFIEYEELKEQSFNVKKVNKIPILTKNVSEMNDTPTNGNTGVALISQEIGVSNTVKTANVSEPKSKSDSKGSVKNETCFKDPLEKKTENLHNKSDQKQGAIHRSQEQKIVSDTKKYDDLFQSSHIPTFIETPDSNFKNDVSQSIFTSDFDKTSLMLSLNKNSHSNFVSRRDSFNCSNDNTLFDCLHFSESKKFFTKSDEKKKFQKDSSQPLSWAALASQAPIPQKSKLKLDNNQQIQNTSSILLKKSYNSINGKFKKEEWFPIYIRGIKQVDERQLKDHLSKKFGNLKFLKTNINIALCDFVTAEAQKKALDAKETTVNGIKIQLEQRESRVGSNYHLGKKAKDLKEKL